MKPNSNLRGILIAAISIPMLLACDRDPACENIQGDDFPAPDFGHIARRYETFCGAFGGASDGWSVAIRDRDELAERQSQVFVIFDVKPTVRWADKNNLIIEVPGVDDINKSEHHAKGINVHYTLSPTLTQAAIQNQLRVKQEWASRMSPNLRRLATRQNRDLFDRFLKWVNANVDHPFS